MKKSLILILILFVISYQLLAQMPNTLTPSEKVYGLSKFWQEVNYNFVYLNKIDRDQWEQDYIELISKVQETENDYEYYRLLQKFCATLKDGHTNIYFPDTIQNNLYRTYFGEYRIFPTHIDGKAIITRTNLSKKDELPIGTEIIAVNGMPTQDYLDKFVKPYIASSTDYVLQDIAVSLMFRAPKGSSFDISFQLPDSEIKELTLTHKETIEEEVYPEWEEGWELLNFKWLNDGIAYVALNSFQDPKIDSLFIEKLPELYKAKKLIIDLRYNGGGNSSYALEIVRYLTNDTLIYYASQESRLHIPAFKAWGKWTEVTDTTGNERLIQSYLSHRDNFFHKFPQIVDTVKLEAKRLVIPTAILIGHRTASSAEDFLIFVDKQEHMIKIGEPTFGSTGQPLMFELPGKAPARVCTKKDTYPDGREFVGYGVQPDIEVKKTLEDYLQDTDPVLEKAIEYLETQ